MFWRQDKLQKATDWHDQGREQAHAGRYQEAIACYDQALKLEPKRADVWYDLGEAHRELHQHEAALSCYDRALRLHPKLVLALRGKAFVLRELDRRGRCLVDGRREHGRRFRRADPVRRARDLALDLPPG